MPRRIKRFRLRDALLWCEDLRQSKGLPAGLFETLNKVAPILDEHGKWMLIGGLAVASYSEPIGTADIDLLVEEDPFATAEAIAAAYPDVKLKPISEALEGREGIRVCFGTSKKGTCADLLSVSEYPALNALETESLRKPNKTSAEGLSIPVIPGGALLLQKILTARTKDLYHAEALMEAGFGAEALKLAQRILDENDLEEVNQALTELELSAGKPQWLLKGA